MLTFMLCSIQFRSLESARALGYGECCSMGYKRKGRGNDSNEEEREVCIERFNGSVSCELIQRSWECFLRTSSRSVTTRVDLAQERGRLPIREE